MRFAGHRLTPLTGCQLVLASPVPSTPMESRGTVIALVGRCNFAGERARLLTLAVHGTGEVFEVFGPVSGHGNPGTMVLMGSGARGFAAAPQCNSSSCCAITGSACRCRPSHSPDKTA